MIKYTSKQDVTNKGIVKRNGKILKLSVLEIWHSKGFLDYTPSKYSADERLNCGLRLALDAYIINRDNLHSSHRLNTKIDNNNNTQSAAILEAMQRYNRAIRSVPAEFWPIVRLVCIEDRDLVAPIELSERHKSHFYYMNRVDLCRGLDRIIDIQQKVENQCLRQF